MEQPRSEFGLSDIDRSALNTVLITSFDWKELSNRLSSFGRTVPAESSGIMPLPQLVYSMARSMCLNNPEFEQSIRKALDYQHRKVIARINSMSIKCVCFYVRQIPLTEYRTVPGVLWALMSDQRESVRKLSRIFLDRIIVSFFYSLNCNLPPVLEIDF